MQEPDDPVAVLRRWEDSGGAWAVLHRGADQVTVALLRCDGGEEVDRFTTSAPAVVGYLAGRRTSED